MTHCRAGARRILWIGVLGVLALRAPGAVAVVEGANAPELERFAARELRGYLEKLYGLRAQAATTPPAGAEALFLVGSPETNAAVRQAARARPFPKVSDEGIVLRRACRL
jgi:hypothetical protein